jgi:serine/threonine protein kinase
MGKQRRVGKYELKETLGRGNFSKVKRAVHVETREVVAIKIVNIQNLEKQGMENQVKREISVLKSMKHDNVVQMKEVLKSTNHIYIVMELITGGELFDKIIAAKK